MPEINSFYPELRKTPKYTPQNKPDAKPLANSCFSSECTVNYPESIPGKGF